MDTLSGTPLGAVLRVLCEADAPADQWEGVLVEAVCWLDGLPPEAQPEWRRAVHCLVLLVRHVRLPGERIRFPEVVQIR